MINKRLLYEATGNEKREIGGCTVHNNIIVIIIYIIINNHKNIDKNPLIQN